MKSRLLLAGACALIPFGSASGAVLIGFNNFTTANTSVQAGGSGTNHLASGFSGFYDPTTGINKTTTGGSTDQTYGDAVLAGTTLGINNGYVGTFAGWFPYLQLQNNSGSSVVLDRLLYDGAANPSAVSLTIRYRYGTSGGFTDLVTTPLTTSYQSFSKSISSLSLNNGQIIQFQFAGGSGGQLDNFAITAVPEPGSALIAAGSLGLLALRRRHA